MSKSKTVKKKRDDSSATCVVISVFIISALIVLGVSYLVTPELFVTYQPDHCYIHSYQTNVFAKIREIRQTSDGKEILYDIVDESSYPGQNQTNSRMKSDFKELYETSYDCNIFDLKARLIGTEASNKNLVYWVEKDRDYWREQAQQSWTEIADLHKKLKKGKHNVGQEAKSN